jgi:hypothetical protein
VRGGSHQQSETSPVAENERKKKKRCRGGLTLEVLVNQV